MAQERRLDQLVSTGQAAKILGCSRRWATQLVDSGQLPCIRGPLQGERLIPRAIVEQLAEQRKREGN